MRPVQVKQGDEVAVSQLLFTVTSMKMEIAVKSKTSGKVRSILHPKGAFVEAGDVVVLIDPS
ncbi:Biotin-requiring enzyme [Necator americanus]|uniref:Biotin-requiring enzyme n=1 Tax=Necator americanus TaxID=51031 RepID=W2TR77_NECAM|nr:Biotin-requiring enzyme [Necator americanus]ETN84179.1 Biotin-requiring enzyme [Necator americanus]